MSENLRISLVQNEICWNDVDINLQNIERILASDGPADWIVFPEMFATGFIADGLPDANSSVRILEWMKQLADQRQSAVSGSVSVSSSGKWYNRLYFITPDGTVDFYDKRHLFCKSLEPKYFQRGYELPVFQYKGWKICPQICYDLRFPVWSRNQCVASDFKYDILLYVANWPASRASVWQTLLAARAIENQCYVVACNCFGTDPAGHFYQGDSRIIAPDGTLLAAAHSGSPDLFSGELSMEKLASFRKQFPVSDDWERFALERESR